MEVLAPAGSPEALRAAVFSGADAVYLGGPAFGARANAKNFSMDELREAVEFCHARGVRVHVTVNTLMKDSELPQAMQFIQQLGQLAVDAVLVQDMGLFSLVRSAAPALPVHASTQMSIHTPAGASYLRQLGAERVVLSREMSLEEIHAVANHTDVELESFVHGALCMSVSGQCYFSAMLGGRSGNRGQCAQPCRLPFAAPGGTGHDLSLKDLSFLRQIDQLEAAGVCSAKIEGRMKRPEYVAAAVTACRSFTDGQTPPEELMENLQAVFSRSGFTTGYLTGKRGKSMFGVRTKEDVTGASEQVFAALRPLYQKERPRVSITLNLLEAEREVTLQVADGTRTAVVTAAIDDLERTPLLADRCRVQLQKTGGTPFVSQEVNVPEGGVRLSISQLNALRREGLEQLMQLRVHREPIPVNIAPIQTTPHALRTTQALPLRVHFRTVDQVPEHISAESIVLPLDTPLDRLDALAQRTGARILLEQPRALFGAEEHCTAQMKAAIAHGYTEFVCQNLGGLAAARELSTENALQLHGGFGLNVTNTAALNFFAAQGLHSAELSFELTGSEMQHLGGDSPRGVLIYGRQALMLTRNCPLANTGRGCRHCTSPLCLTDRKQKKFPVLCTGQGAMRYSEVLNSVPLWLGDKQSELSALDFGVCRFTTETAEECAEILTALQAQHAPQGDFTRGLYARGVI